MSITTIFLFIVSIVTSYVGYYVIRNRRDFLAFCFLGMIFSVSFWSLGLGLFSVSTDPTMTLWFVKSYYITAIGIPAFFFLFSLSFQASQGSHRAPIWSQLLILTTSLSLIATIILKDSFIIKELVMTNPKNVILDLYDYLIYATFILGFIIWGFINFVISYFKNKNNPSVQSKLKFIILWSIAPFIFGLWFNLILPYFSYRYVWAGPIFGLAIVMIFIYSVFRHRLFDTKSVTVEVFTFMLWLFIFMRSIVSSTTTEQIGNLILLVPTTVIGLFLISSVRQEIKARNQIEALAMNLEKINKRLLEYDKQKSEFVSLASHQLRAPLATIKGYSSMIMEGDFGEVTPPQIEAVKSMFDSTQNLVTIVSDYLDISSIEDGKMQYDFEVFNIVDLVEETVENYRPMIEKANLSFSMNKSAERRIPRGELGFFESFSAIPQKIDYQIEPDRFDQQGCILDADKGKIRQVIGNIIDNAIKYTPKGKISVSVKLIKDIVANNIANGVKNNIPNKKNKIEIVISDTGVGIHPDVLPKLFEKFSRAPTASKTNIIGTGLGLYVAKKMIEAHHGHIWAESKGLDKGSSFHIELELI
jgi:signal transduction histidine kinase